MKTKIKSLISFLLINVALIAQDSTSTAFTSNSINVNSADNKDSVNIFLLMGLTRQSDLWNPLFIDSLKNQIPQARIFFLDLPGSGKYVHQTAPLSVQGMVDFMRPDVLSIMQEYKGDNIICATSLAGMVACQWTISYRNDFQGLVMINASFKDICSQNERAKPQVRKTMFKILISNSVERRERLAITINSNKPETYDSIAEINTRIQNKKKMTRLNILRQTIAGMRYSPNGNKPELPLLIVGSKADQIVCQDCIQKTNDVFGGTLVWSETSGHSLPTDDPVWLSTQISNWVINMRKENLLVKN